MTLPRTITYTIDDLVEDGNVAGWVRAGYADPAFADHPTKLVSEARTRKRWAEVARSYPEIGPAVPVPPVVPPTGPTMMLDMKWETLAGYMNTSGFSGSTTLAIRFAVPADYHSTQPARISAAEYGGGPVMRKSCISLTPFDFDQPNAIEQPIVQFWMQVGGASGSRVVLQPGQTYYCNVRNIGMPPDAEAEMGFAMTVPASGS